MVISAGVLTFLIVSPALIAAVMVDYYLSKGKYHKLKTEYHSEALARMASNDKYKEAIEISAGYKTRIDNLVGLLKEAGKEKEEAIKSYDGIVQDAINRGFIKKVRGGLHWSRDIDGKPTFKTKLRVVEK